MTAFKFLSLFISEMSLTGSCFGCSVPILWTILKAVESSGVRLTWWKWVAGVGPHSPVCSFCFLDHREVNNPGTYYCCHDFPSGMDWHLSKPIGENKTFLCWGFSARYWSLQDRSNLTLANGPKNSGASAKKLKQAEPTSLKRQNELQPKAFFNWLKAFSMVKIPRQKRCNW